MLASQRALFDIPNGVHYLNCAYMSPLLNVAADAGVQGIKSKRHPWQSTSDDFFTLSEHSRSLFAQLLNCSADNIAIIPSVSYGTAIATRNIPLQAGDEVLVLAEEFPSNIYAWRRACETSGASICSVERPENLDWSSAVIEQLGAQTAVAVLSQTHWIDGGLLDLVRISAVCRQHNIKLVLDVTQSLGVLALDLEAIQPDFVFCAGYKWLLGPYSLGFMYVASDYFDGVPLEQGWVNRPGAQDFSRLIDYVDELLPDARRFDVGERSNFALHPVSAAALQQLLEWGQGNIQSALSEMNSYLLSRLKVLGFTAGSSGFRSPHYLGVAHVNPYPDDLLAQLATDNIFISARGDRLRITPHLYNNEQDFDVLVDALARIMQT